MQTEDLGRTSQGPESGGLSPVFHERVPREWRIADERDRPIPLSLAGHVLHFGQTYNVWVGPFTEGGLLPDIRFSSKPSWLVPVGEQRVVDKHDRKFAVVKFQVRRESNWMSFYQWLREIRLDALEVEATLKGSTNMDRRNVVCPVVARSRWLPSLIVLAIFGAILVTAVELLLHQGIRAISALLTTGATPDSWQISWGWLVVGAIISPGVAFVLNVIHLRSRSGELEREFRSRWPSVAS